MRAALLLLVLLPFVATAEIAYVTDNLRLGLHQAADTSGRAFRTLDSGQELDIISRDRNYAYVALPDGVEGYVKAAYLVFDKPAKLIVSEVQAAFDDLQQELETTKSEFATPAATIRLLEQQVAEKDVALESSTSRVSDLVTEIAGYRIDQGQYRYSLPFKWVGGAMFVCLLVGFLCGLWWLDYKSRRRHGGIRIF